MSESKNTIRIADREIGTGQPTYIIAELSANHGQEYDRAVELLEIAHSVGADAVKLQTYLPETLTIDCDAAPFRISGTIWDGENLFNLYRKAYTPWEWQPRLKQRADELGIHLFSTAFDESSVDFLETMNVPAYKIASFELVDLPLLRRVALTGKPMIISTGMATLSEIAEAVQTVRDAGASDLALLKCTSAYPAEASAMNLRTIPHLSAAFDVPVGLSDHSLEVAVPVSAVTLGACIIEKHLTLSRSEPGPDSAFSLEPDEFQAMVRAVRTAEQAVGHVHYGVDADEASSRQFRRSLFVVGDVKAGELFSAQNVRSIRPGGGLHTRYLDQIIGRVAASDVPRGTPFTWDLISKTNVYAS